MFLKTMDLLKIGYNPTVTVNKRHECLKGEVFGLPYKRGLDLITAMFSSGYYSSSTGKTHFGNYTKWTVCGTSSAVHHVKGKPVTCQNCLKLFKRSFPLNIAYDKDSTLCLPVLATDDARVKYSQMALFKRIKRHAYRKNSGKWLVSRIHEGRRETVYNGQPLRVLLSPQSKTRETAPIMTHYFPQSSKDIGLTVATFDGEFFVKDRPLMIPSSLCFAVIRNSERYVSMPFDNRAMRHIKMITGGKQAKAVNELLNNWKVYISYQDTMREIITGHLKPVKGHEWAILD